ncbi:MAG: hypothetical protein LBU32_10655 [Clostridiales bacterium]|jgi:hypothetical protein|nr:hypothetical protein [Clostridiales bacterium]
MSEFASDPSEIFESGYEFVADIFGENGKFSISIQKDCLSDQMICLLHVLDDFVADPSAMKEYIKRTGANDFALAFKEVAPIEGGGIGFLFVLPRHFVRIEDFKNSPEHLSRLKENHLRLLGQVVEILRISPGSALSPLLMFLRPSDMRLAFMPFPGFIESGGRLSNWKYPHSDGYGEKTDAYTAAAFSLYALSGQFPQDVVKDRIPTQFREIVCNGLFMPKSLNSFNLEMIKASRSSQSIGLVSESILDKMRNLLQNFFKASAEPAAEMKFEESFSEKSDGKPLGSPAPKSTQSV